MKIKRIICAALAVATLALSGCGQKKEEAFDVSKVKLTSEQTADVSSKTDNELNKHKFSGSAVITLNTNTVYDKSFGYTSEKKSAKNDSNTSYQISSVTKVFTGAAIALLFDEGKLKKSDTLSKFFIAAKDSKELKNITVEDLLLKKKDFGRYADSFITTNDQLSKYNTLVNKNAKTAEKQIKQKITELILSTSANQTSKTADSNYYLLGRIIERASGMDYKDYISEKIVKKLSLKNTGFVSSKNKMTGYNSDTGKWRHASEQPTINSFGYMYSSYGITASADDAAKLFSAIINKTLTKTDIIKEARKSTTNFGYGLTVDGRNLHVEGRTFLHSSYVFINPENLECATLLSNTSGESDISTIGKDIHQVINSKINGILLENTDEKEFGL